DVRIDVRGAAVGAHPVRLGALGFGRCRGDGLEHGWQRARGCEERRCVDAHALVSRLDGRPEPYALGLEIVELGLARVMRESRDAPDSLLTCALDQILDVAD